MPAFPTTSPDPCDITPCAECIEGATEDTGEPIESNIWIKPTFILSY